MQKLTRLLCLVLLLALCCAPALAEEDTDWSIEEDVILTDEGEEIPDPDAQEAEDSETAGEYTARDDLIDRIIALGREKYEETGGRAQRAHYAGDIYVCKNFTVYLFRQNREAFLIDRIIALGREKYEETGGRAQRAHYAGDIYVCKNFTVYLFRQNREAFRMAEYPEVPLVIPNNLPPKECRPYSYGLAWEEIPASEGNPFYEAASFRYNKELSPEENMELALDFMRQVKKGDYFQMSAKYEYGTGAHSAIMIADYDPKTETVRWMDSNMRGKKKDGIRYGIVQFDEEKSIQWWAECFCKKTRGATLYRLRDDIIYADDVQ